MLVSLQAKEFLYEQPAFPESEYVFKHALTQDVAYGTVLQEQRKALHEQIGQALEEIYGEKLDDHYSELAHHYGHSENRDKAIEYLCLVGQQALRRSAYAEASGHLNAALGLLAQLSQTQDRAHQEITLQLSLSEILIATRGYAAQEIERANTRALELCQQLEDTLQLFSVLAGLRVYYNVRAEYKRAQQLGEQMLTRADDVKEPGLLLAAH